MLTKGMGYYADGEAVKTPGGGNSHGGGQTHAHDYYRTVGIVNGSANRRSVWNDISPEPYGGSHFATFPSDLPRICIQASTSERGCCAECGSQWARVTQHQTSTPKQNDDYVTGSGRFDGNGGGSWTDAETKTTGWRATCNCNADVIPATVLDPFAGTFTTGMAAQKLGRRAVGVDISEAYLDQAVRRLSAVTLPMGI
jgi:hypothetical protein